MSSLYAKFSRGKYKNEEEIQSVSTANICVSTFDCFPLSWGIRWGGAHSQYFPIQPFTNSVTSCHNCVTIVSHSCHNCVTLCHNRVTILKWSHLIAPPAQCTVLDGAQFLSKKSYWGAHFSPTSHPQGLSTRVSQDGIMKVLTPPTTPWNNACAIIMSPLNNLYYP